MTETDQTRLNAQFEASHEYALWKALQPLRSCVSFMNTGAHPDDETSAMLAALALRDGVKLSHACATRGEGGQNALGTEAGAELGALRTREMERAAQILGMTQYWLSTAPDDTISDFGFSKNGRETLRKWGEKRTLERFVLILRTERPDIVCPTFLDIPGQHGHHRAMTQCAFEAVQLAADPKAFTHQNLPAWQVKKLYLPAWSGSGNSYDDDVPPPPETTRVDATGADPVLGADYSQIAQWSRQFHRTQGMGDWIESRQPSIWPLHLAWTAKGEALPEASIFDDLPATLSDLPGYAEAPDLIEPLCGAQKDLDACIAAWPEKQQILHHATAALGSICEAIEICPEAAKPEVLHRLEAKQRQLARVIYLACEIDGRLVLSTSEARPGDAVTLTFHSRTKGLKPDLQVRLPDGWQSSAWEDGTCRITVPVDAPPSDPYPDTWHPERANSPLHVELNWTCNGQPVALALDPVERLQVHPTFSASLSKSAAVVKLSDPQPVHLQATHIAPEGATPDLPEVPGWSVTRSASDFTVTPKPTLQAGLHEFPLSLDGRQAASVSKFGYPHTGRLLLGKPAVLRIRALDIALPQARIGYIGGGNDRVDHWLRHLGLTVDSLDDAALRGSRFAGYDTILVGIFAFRTRPDLSRRLDALHAWIRAGGNLVTLYHRPWDNWSPDSTPPAYLKIGKPSLRWRVTGETAEVTHLDPGHPLLTTPNRITGEDWQGWHKERGLYFAAEWDSAYKPLLSMADPDEVPLTGALLSARIGSGRHTHTSLILHHQLEHLVPGAFRLLANLLNPA